MSGKSASWRNGYEAAMRGQGVCKPPKSMGAKARADYEAGWREGHEKARAAFESWQRRVDDLFARAQKREAAGS